MTATVMRRLGLALCFMFVMALGADRAEAGKFDKCYKSFNKQNKRCNAIVKKMNKLQSSLDKATGQIRKLMKKKDKIDKASMSDAKRKKALDKIKGQVEAKVDLQQSKTEAFQTAIKDYDTCMDDAQKILIDCRLDKKSFKSGCDESKLDKRIKAIYAKEDDLQAEHDQCLHTCVKEDFGNRKTLDKVIQRVMDKGHKKGILVQTLNKYNKCSSACLSTFDAKKKKFAEEAKAKRLKVLKKCLNLEDFNP